MDYTADIPECHYIAVGYTGPCTCRVSRDVLNALKLSAVMTGGSEGEGARSDTICVDDKHNTKPT